MINLNLSPPKKNQGSALLIALFIIALSVILIAEMTGRLHREIQIEQRLFIDEELYHIAEGSLLWAKGQLLKNAKNVNMIQDILPLSFQQHLKNGIEISARLEDEQAKFNLNSLTDIEYGKLFARLLKQIHPELTTVQAQEMSQSLMNYLIHKRFPNQPEPIRLWNVSELNHILPKASWLEQLKPIVTTLPEVTPLNINSLNEIIFLSLSEKITSKDAEHLLNDRLNKKRFNNISQWIREENLAQSSVPSNLLTAVSQYFRLHVTLTRYKDTLSMDVIFKRDVVNHQALVHIISEQVYSHA